MAFKYSTALVIQPSREAFGNDYEKAKAEHDSFVDALRQLEVNILEYGPEERRPNAHKVGDIAVIINGTALMCRPYGADRQSEVSVVRQTLKKEMGLTIVELNNDQAQLEASDVLFTGQEIIVGISPHTNEAGAQSVARAFPEYPTTIVAVPSPLVCLKEAVCMAGINVMAISNSDAARKVFKSIGEVASSSYKVLHLAEPIAASVLYVNGCLMHYDHTMVPETCQLFENKIDYPRYPLELPILQSHGAPLFKLALLSGRVRNQRFIASTMP
ncbi:unnamed protein product [Hymenolepis diminuta]|uniref:Dimethylargininase n=1 Tax=Hymenolepis diminuta TaxID=6216 RepID=A0A0R3S7N6_HYMDI|nr:unnamed protein product [Hymenolepis diminuta]VUZ55018.1 unnamed protein product [Hymenolepis diminuta]